MVQGLTNVPRGQQAGREGTSRGSGVCSVESRLGSWRPSQHQWGGGDETEEWQRASLPPYSVKGRRQGESMLRQRCLPGDAGTGTGTVHAHQELSAHREPSHFLPTPFPKNLHLFKMSLGCSLVPFLSSTAGWHGAAGWAAPMGLPHPPTNFPEQAP